MVLLFWFSTSVNPSGVINFEKATIGALRTQPNHSPAVENGIIGMTEVFLSDADWVTRASAIDTSLTTKLPRPAPGPEPAFDESRSPAKLSCIMRAAHARKSALEACELELSR